MKENNAKKILTTLNMTQKPATLFNKISAKNSSFAAAQVNMVSLHEDQV